jgi:hypothetical protein
MTSATVMTRPVSYYCGGKNRQEPGTCELRAGWGTDHKGTGHCRKHGGNTKGQRVKAHRDEAINFAVGALGVETGENPLDALLNAVRLACGAVTYWRLRLTGYEPGDPAIPREIIEGYSDALDRQTRVAKAALDGKLDEKLVQIVQREAETLTLAFEDALAAAGNRIDAKLRLVLVQGFTAALAKVEDEPLTIEGTGRTHG